MKDEIVRKLQALLLRPPVEDEPRIVYLLTQVRKIFERDDTLETSLPTLRFYCNWALHTKLDHTAARFFLREVDPIVTLQGNHDQNAEDRFNRLLTLQAFRDELRSFLALNAIDSALCDNDDHWRAFLSAYSRVVENCEVAIQGAPLPPHGPLNLSVQSVSISPVMGRNAPMYPDRPYPMEWVIIYTDGRRGRLLLSEHGLLGAVVEIR